MNYMIPAASIVIMALAVFLCLAVPAALYSIWRRKHGLNAAFLLPGIGVFLVFTLLLQQFLHLFVLQADADGNILIIRQSPWMFVAYMVISGSVISETGRYASFRLLSKRYADPGAGLAFGIGYGGTEAFILTGLPLISYISAAVRVNAGGMSSVVNDAFMLTLIDTLHTTQPAALLTQSITVLATVSAGVSLSVIVLGSVIIPGKRWLFPAAVALHAALRLVPSMYQAGYYSSIWPVTALTLIPAALIIAAAVNVFRNIQGEACPE